MEKIWIRRDRQDRKEKEITERRVIEVLTGVYSNLESAMNLCSKTCPLSSGWADYWPKK